MTIGTIHQHVLNAIVANEKETSETEFEIWCEAKIPTTENDDKDGEYVRCWPQCCKDKGPWHDWVSVQFDSDQDDVETSSPAKLLAIYSDKQGDLKAIVHSVDYKTRSGVESSTGDSQLVTHYRLQFQNSGYPTMYSVYLEDVQHCLLAFTAQSYVGPLPPRVCSVAAQKSHTVMCILPRHKWAKLFLTWARELMERQEEGDYRLV